MHLVYIWSNRVHGLPEGLTWPLLVGAAYGAIRFVRDVIEGAVRFYQRDQELTRLIAKIKRETDEPVDPD